MTKYTHGRPPTNVVIVKNRRQPNQAGHQTESSSSLKIEASKTGPELPSGTPVIPALVEAPAQRVEGDPPVTERCSPQAALVPSQDQHTDEADASLNLKIGGVPPRKIFEVAIDNIFINGDRRACHRAELDKLIESMAIIGQQAPINVRQMDGVGPLGAPGWVLVAGYHRLQAAKALGLRCIQCLLFEGDERAARLWEISENLAHAALTALEEAEHISDWLRLTENERVSGQNVQKRRVGRPQGGFAQAARELPLPGETFAARRKRAERSRIIAGISPQAKAAAKDVGLDNQAGSLLKIGKEETPEAQLAKVKELSVPRPRLSSPKAEIPTPVAPQTEVENLEIPPFLDRRLLSAEEQRQFDDLVQAWAIACELVRDRFRLKYLSGNVTATTMLESRSIAEISQPHSISNKSVQK